jgi:hypothetical protein
MPNKILPPKILAIELSQTPDFPGNEIRPRDVPCFCMTCRNLMMTLELGSDQDLALSGLLGIVDALKGIVEDGGSDHLGG